MDDETLDALTEWMTNLPNPLKEIPVINLAIPGNFRRNSISFLSIKCNNANILQLICRFLFVYISGSHDSMSYGIKPGADIAPDAVAIVSHLYRVIPCVVRRWAITQSLNAFDQLTYGIRYVVQLLLHCHMTCQ